MREVGRKGNLLVAVHNFDSKLMDEIDRLNIEDEF